MLKNFDDMQKFGKDNMDVAMKSFGAVSKGFQAIAAEVADYSKKSFEQSTAALEKLMGAKSVDKAMEVQSDYIKTSYEGFVAEATKIGELYADIAKESYKPYEAALCMASIEARSHDRAFCLSPIVCRMPHLVRRACCTAFWNSAVIASEMPSVGLTSK
jgi:hypothetical protein